MIVIEINIIINGDEITMSANIPYFFKNYWICESIIWFFFLIYGGLKLSFHKYNLE